MLNTELFDGRTVFQIRDESDLESLVEVVEEVECEKTADEIRRMVCGYMFRGIEVAVRPYYFDSSLKKYRTMSFACFPVKEYRKKGYVIMDFYSIFSYSHETYFDESEMDISEFF